MYQIVALLVGALFVVGSAFAQDFGASENGDLKSPYLFRISKMLFKAGFHNESVDPRTLIDCHDLLVATQRRMGRELTDEEIARLMPSILAALEKTAAQPARLPPNSPFCEGLASDTRVLTPKGPIDIVLLKNGDEVLSFDKDRGRIVINKIVSLHGGIAKSILGIRPAVKGFGPHLLFSPEQPFYTPTVSVFSSLRTLHNNSELLYLELFSAKQPFAVSRGGFIEHTRETPVFQLELEGEPNNFFAGGLLVQSYVPSAGGK